MELKWLEDFVMLAREGSFSRAAAMRNVTQPAYSRRIRSLEHWIGVTLIDRSSTPVSLTHHGEEFLPHATQMMAEALSVRQDFQLGKSADKQSVRLVTLHGLSMTLVPSLTEHFLTLQPRAHLEILPSIQGLDTHYDALDSGAAHVLITYGRGRNGRNTTAYLETTLFEDAFVPVATPAFIKARGGLGMSLAKTSTPIITYRPFTFSHGFTNPVIEAAKQILKLHDVAECSLAEGQKALVLKGLGMAWLPVSCMVDELETGQLANALGPSFCAPVEVHAIRRNDLDHPMALAFWDSLMTGAEPMRNRHGTIDVGGYSTVSMKPDADRERSHAKN